MIEQTSRPVWGFGSGMARTNARITYAPEGVSEPDPANPAYYRTLGPMRFRRAGVGFWFIDVDVVGVTNYRYLSAKIIYPGSGDVLQANIAVDPATPDGSRLVVQILDPQGGPPADDDPADLTPNSALCIEAIVDQRGEPVFSTGPGLVDLPVPGPAPRPPPDDDGDPPPRIL